MSTSYHLPQLDFPSTASPGQRIIFLDGRLVPESEAKVSVLDHGLLYGDGVFEGMRFYEGRVFRLREHLLRLMDSAKSILLPVGLTVSQLQEVILATIAANGLKQGYVRVVVTRGVGPLGLDPYRCPKASVIVIASTLAPYPEELYRAGLRMITCATRCPIQASLSPRVKSLNHLSNVMARIECSQAGCEEGIMLNEQGYVADCTADNVFVLKNGQVTTPSVASGAMDGVARRTVMECLLKLEIPVREDAMTRHEIYTAEECFIAGTEGEVMPVVELDRRKIGDGRPGAVARQLMRDYAALVRSEGTEVPYS
jgi:branched-chain amino acid aminotransferase